jgi:hypothetical protein
MRAFGKGNSYGVKNAQVGEKQKSGMAEVQEVAKSVNFTGREVCANL